MSLNIFDTHTHLDASDFDQDREEVIKRAQTAGVSRILTVGAGYKMDSVKNAIALAEKYDFIWASAGVHPHDAEIDFAPQELQSLAMHPRVIAIGETGLDFYRDWAPKDLQEKWFLAQISIAKELKKPLIIHSRAAASECLGILQKEGASSVGGVFHCYSEDAEFAKKLLEINFYVSFPGTITFKNAHEVRKTAKAIPLDQILLETDAPYMAPVPYRGKRCETSFVVETAKILAEVKGISLEECAKLTTNNALNLFGIE